MKVYISVDMEGVCGVVGVPQVMSPDLSSQVTRTEEEYQTARKLLTEEVNAAIEGALDAGADQITVNDGHGNMRNLILNDLNEKAQFILGSPKPLCCMEGIDASFDAAAFIGYHARVDTPTGVMGHNFVGKMSFNGKQMGEYGIHAAIAGYYGVPVVIISGDDQVVAQAKSLLGNIEGVAVKQGISYSAARCLHPKEARRRIKEAVSKALSNVEEFKPFMLQPPISFDVEFSRTVIADVCELIPGVKRTGTNIITYVSNDFIEIYKVLRLTANLGYNLRLFV